MQCGLKKVEEAGDELRLIPEVMNPGEMTELAGAFPKLGLRVRLSGVPYLACRLKSGTNAPNLATEILEKYLQIHNKNV